MNDRRPTVVGRPPIDSRILAACLLVASLFVGTVRGQKTDTISLVEGKAMRGSISKLSKSTVTIDATAGKRDVPVNEIKWIVFDGEPSALRQSRELISDGQYQAALERLAKMDSQRVSDPRIAAELRYYKALATARKGDQSARAVKLLLEFVKQNRDTYHFFEAVEVLGDLAMQLGNYQKAVSYYGQLTKAPWPEYKLKGAFLTATSLQAQNKTAEALKGFKSVIETKATSNEAMRYRQLATVGKAACSVTGKNWSALVDEMNQLIAKNDPQDAELFARTYNALGACYSAAKKPNEAIHQYLHVHLLYDQVDAAHAEALFHLTNLWTKVGQAKRANEYRKLLTERYAGTVWAKQ